MRLQIARFLAVSFIGFVPMMAETCLDQNSSQEKNRASKNQRLREWPQLKGNSGFTGLSSDDSVKPPLKLVWSYRLDGDASGDAGAGVIVAGGKVFVPVANSHSIVALDADNGRFCWEHGDQSIGQIGYLGHAPVPAYHQGRLIFEQRRNASGVMALDAETGKVQWTQPLTTKGTDYNRGGLPVANGMVYCSEGGPDPAVTTYDVLTGKKVWRTLLGKEVGEFAIGPTVAGGRVFVSTRANTRRGPKPDNFRGQITALDAKTGKILWSQKNVYSWSPMASDGKVLVCPMWSSPDEKLYLLDCTTGKTIWARTRVANHYNPPVTFTKNLLLYQPWGPKLHAMSRLTGNPQWTFHNEFTSAGCCTPAVSGRYAYIGTSVPIRTGDLESLRGFRVADTPSSTGKYGTVDVIDLTTGKSVWRFPTANTVCGDPAIAYGRLYFASRDGRVYCCAPAKPGQSMTPEAKDNSPSASQSEIAKLLSTASDPKQKPTTDWPMQGGSPNRVGIKSARLKLPLKLAWKFDTQGRVLTSAAVVDGVVYASSESGKIVAVNAKGGRRIWEFDTGQPVRCSPAVAGGTVYCAIGQRRFLRTRCAHRKTRLAVRDGWADSGIAGGRRRRGCLWCQRSQSLRLGSANRTKTLELPYQRVLRPGSAGDSRRSSVCGRLGRLGLVSRSENRQIGLEVVHSGLDRSGVLLPRSTLGSQSVLRCEARSGQGDVAADRQSVVRLRWHGVRWESAVSVRRARPARNGRSHVRFPGWQGRTTSCASCSHTQRRWHLHPTAA